MYVLRVCIVDINTHTRLRHTHTRQLTTYVCTFKHSCDYKTAGTVCVCKQECVHVCMVVVGKGRGRGRYFVRDVLNAQRGVLPARHPQNLDFLKQHSHVFLQAPSPPPRSGLLQAMNLSPPGPTKRERLHALAAKEPASDIFGNTRDDFAIR